MAYSEKENLLFPLNIQTPLNWFAFFIGYPFLYIFGNSVTLFIFILILFRLNTGFIKIFEMNSWAKKIIAGFGFVAFLSLVFAPWSELREFNIGSFFLLFQFIYWFIIAIFIIEYYKSINWKPIIICLSIGLILQIIIFYIIDKLNINLGFMNLLLANKAARNSLVFQMIVIGPLLLGYFVYINKNKYYFYCTIIGLVLASLFTEGRAGVIIITFQCLLFIGSKIFLKPWFAGTLLILFFIFSGLNTFFEPFLKLASYKIESYNPRLAGLMQGKAEGTSLEEDRSLLEREMHRSKGIEIISKFPFLGIGLGNYKNYDADLDILQSIGFYRMSFKNKYDLNRRGPHNAYVQIGSETGLIGLFVFMFCLLPPLYILLTKNSGNPMSIAILLSLAGTMTHFYSIAAVTGTISWVIIGIANAEALWLLKKNK